MYFLIYCKNNELGPSQLHYLKYSNLKYLKKKDIR